MRDLLKELAEKHAATLGKDRRYQVALLAFGQELLGKMAEDEFPGYGVIGCAAVRRRLREIACGEPA
jgi:hypothetical protein